MGRRLKASDPSKRERRKPAPVETKRLAHPQVWETALRLAEGHRDRIVVESYCRVVVIRK